MILVAFVSFYLNIKGVKRDAGVTFYAPEARFWELICGGILAWLALYKGGLGGNLSKYINGWLLAAPYRGKQNINGKALCNLLSFFGVALLAYGFLGIDKNISFPSWWATIPVLGAILIILAGPNAWVNRRILSNKTVVWFGLISYPLYLWHWPLLSFARIVEGEAPSRNIRMAAIVISVALAYFTYRFVERPIRLEKHSRIKAGVLVVLITVTGYIGFETYRHGGFEFRTSEYEHYRRQLVPPLLVKNAELCKSLIPSFTGDCIASNANAPLDSFKLIFFGDSHARSLAMGLAELDYRTSFIQFGKNGCPPLKGVDRYYFGSSFGCNGYYNQIAKLFESSVFADSTLLISFYNAAYYSGEGIGDAGLTYISNGGVHIQPHGKKLNSSSTLFSKTFIEGLEGALEDVSPRVKKVVLVLQPPELAVSVDRCLSRPFRLAKDDCRIKRSIVLERQEGYRGAVSSIINRFDNVIQYDPLDLFCDSLYCYPFREGELLYRDDNHVGIEGAKVILNDMIRKGVLH
jgi:hypothetical protein